MELRAIDLDDLLAFGIDEVGLFAVDPDVHARLRAAGVAMLLQGEGLGVGAGSGVGDVCAVGGEVLQTGGPARGFQVG
jgi:hypothetical protein